MKNFMGNITKLLIALVFVASLSMTLESCASSHHGMKVRSSGHIGNPKDKNHHVWGK